MAVLRGEPLDRVDAVPEGVPVHAQARHRGGQRARPRPQQPVTALTVAYDILVGGLLVPILGGLIWRRGTNVGALAAMAVGPPGNPGRDVRQLASGLVVYVVGSMTSKPTDPEVLAEWDRRSRVESTAKMTVQQIPSA